MRLYYAPFVFFVCLFLFVFCLFLFTKKNIYNNNNNNNNNNKYMYLSIVLLLFKISENIVKWQDMSLIKKLLITGVSANTTSKIARSHLKCNFSFLQSFFQLFKANTIRWQNVF